MSRGERKAMMRRDHPALSLSRQCKVLSISRSSFYYAPKGESPENLALMRLMGLEAIYQAPRTSTPHPTHRIYPYLLKGD